jgi:CBS domain containing-hemolysin-like protein
MIARGAIIGVSEQARFAELKALFASAGHSRLPVYGETLDDPKGMIHIRDMFSAMESLEPDVTVAETGLVRPVLFAPGSMAALDLLLEMQRKRIHMALVIDEYGATDGLVSLEDVLEIIVGEIEDEHDIAEDPQIEQLDGGFAINAQAAVADVEQLMGIRLLLGADDRDIETIGGYVTAFLGRVPEQGETVTSPSGLTFTILEGDQRRIRRLHITHPAMPAEA